MNRTQSIFSLLALSVLISACSEDANVAQPSVEASPEPPPSAIEIPAEAMAILQVGNGGPEVLEYRRVPVSEPGAGEVLIKVAATGINPIDRRNREGGGRRPAPAQAGAMGAPAEGMAAPQGGMGAGTPADAGGPSIPGGDLSGIVAKLGEGVTNVAVGDAVFTKLANGSAALNGSYAEYAIAQAEHVNPKPTGLTFAEAAGLGTVGVTALRTIWHADVQEGERVFINGIGGGIGSSAAQFAKERGAYVLGTASGRHAEYLQSIGVDEHINYREVQFDEVIQEPVDVVIETVSTATANQALNIMKSGGRLVSIAGAATPELCEEKGVNCSRIGGSFGWPNTQMLAEVYRLAEAGHYRLNVDSTFPLEEAGAAQEQNYNVGTSGKVVLIVDAELANQK